MTTDKQTDYFKNYANVEQITGGVFRDSRFIGQLKNGRWAVWSADILWGGNTTRPLRLRDLSGRLASFNTKEEAEAFSNRTR